MWKSLINQLYFLIIHLLLTYISIHRLKSNVFYDGVISLFEENYSPESCSINSDTHECNNLKNYVTTKIINTLCPIWNISVSNFDPWIGKKNNDKILTSDCEPVILLIDVSVHIIQAALGKERFSSIN